MSAAIDDLPVVWDDKYGGNGYFAGTGAGIVTINGQPAAREIICFDATSLKVVRKVWSLANGHFLVPNLSTEHKYLVLCRDHKGEYAPAGWDHRTPATELDYAGQQALLKSWL